MAYTNSITAPEQKKINKNNSSFREISTAAVDASEDLGKKAWDQLKGVASNYSAELTMARNMITKVTQQYPVAVLLGSACVGFYVGYMARGRMQKSSTEKHS